MQIFTNLNIKGFVLLGGLLQTQTQLPLWIAEMNVQIDKTLVISLIVPETCVCAMLQKMTAQKMILWIHILKIIIHISLSKKVFYICHCYFAFFKLFIFKL